MLSINVILISALILPYAISEVLPGTKWCGVPYIAKAYNDLGTDVNRDLCCREHHHCVDVMLAGEQKYGLIKDDINKRYHNCECDRLLYLCLSISGISFETYARDRKRCFRYDFPTLSCKKFQTSIDGTDTRCIRYEFDYRREKIYQWFDIPYNYKNPWYD